MGLAAMIVVFVAVAIAVVRSRAATQYMVGGTAGWDASTDYNTWLQGKTFAVGDTLLFQYSLLHSVMEVSKSDYDSCQTSNALQSFSNGNTQITLSKPGNMYFICGTPGHCAGGMKIAVNAQGAANAGSPAVSPASAPTSSPASGPASSSKPVSSTPLGITPAVSPNAHSPATRSPVPKSAATTISYNGGRVLGLLTGLLLFSCI